MTRCLLPSAVAFLFVAAPAVAEEPPGLADRMDRLGKLPADLIKAKKSDAELVEALFLATLTRLPADAEKEPATKHLAAAKNREEAARDLAWALINTKEFVKLNGLDKDLHSALVFLNGLSEKWGKGKEKK